MERIGIAASKMAKGNLWVYNLLVVVIACMFSVFIFVLAGTSIVLALIVVGYVASGVSPADLSQEWREVIRICMGSLTAVVSVVNLFAILKNLKLRMQRKF